MARFSALVLTLGVKSASVCWNTAEHLGLTAHLMTVLGLQAGEFMKVQWDTPTTEPARNRKGQTIIGGGDASRQRGDYCSCVSSCQRGVTIRRAVTRRNLLGAFAHLGITLDATIHLVRYSSSHPISV